MITRKLILIDQMVTDLTDLSKVEDIVSTEDIRKEAELILDKLAELKEITDEEADEAEKEYERGEEER